MRCLTDKTNIAFVGIETLVLNLTKMASVKGVAKLRFYPVKWHLIHAMSRLFIGRKNKFNLPMRNVFFYNVCKCCYNFCYASLIVSAKEGFSISMDDTVTKAVEELGFKFWIESKPFWTRTKHNSSTIVVFAYF